MPQESDKAQATQALNEAVRLAASGATVLMPTTRAMRFVQALADRQLSRNADAWPTPDVLPFGAWLERSWAGAQLRGVAGRVLLSAAQQYRLWRNTAPEAQLRSLAAEASAAWRLSRQYRIPVDSSSMSATAESRFFVAWAGSYRRRCDSQGWTDAASLADDLVPLLPRLELPKQLVLYGFAELTPQQQALLEALRSQGVAVSVLEPPGEVSAAQSVCIAADDRDAEFRLAARWARAHLERNPQARPGVVVLGLDEVRAQAESIFREVLHPEAAAGSTRERAFEIALGRPLSQVPVAAAALQLLRLCAGELHWTEVSALLRSPYLGGGVAEAGARARLDVELRGLLPERVSLQTLLQALKHKQDIAPLLRSRMEALAPLAPEPATEQSFTFWQTRAEKILGMLRWPGDGEGGRALDSADYQAAKRWRELLSECAALDLVSGPAPFATFVSEVQRAAAGTIFKPEAVQVPVQIMDEREAAGVIFDALWVCGASDEALPGRGRPDPFLPLALQREARAPHASPELERLAALRTLANLLALSGEVVISYPRQEQDSDLRMSPLLAAIPKGEQERLLLSAPSDWRERMRGAAKEVEEDAAAPPVAASDIRHANTKLLELQSNCPFRAFAERRLNAEPMEVPEDGLPPIQRGRLADFALEFIWMQLHDQHGLRSATGESRQQLVERAAEVAIERLESEHGPIDAWTTRLLQVERDRLCRLLTEWLLEEDKRIEPFEALELQKEVRLELAGVNFHGRVDRVDRLGSDFVVTDYKTGAQKHSGAQWMPPRIELPQLPFYAAALMAQGREVAGVAFGELRIGDCRFSGVAQREGALPLKSNRVAKDCGGDYRAHIARWRPALEDLVRQFLNGHAKVDPLRWPGTVSNSTCAYCHLAALCRVGELEAPQTEAAEGDEESGDE